METKVLTAHVPLPLARKIDDLAARLAFDRGPFRLSLCMTI